VSTKPARSSCPFSTIQKSLVKLKFINTCLCPFVSVFVYSPVHPSIQMSVCLPGCLSVYLPANLVCTCPSFGLSVLCHPVGQSVRPTVHKCLVCLLVCLSVCLLASLHVSLSVRMIVYLPIHTSVCAPSSQTPVVHLSVYL
jgi:hypothetical protein